MAIVNPDTTPPSAPASLSALDTPADQGGSVSLSWPAATDNVGVTGYKLYRGTAPGVYGAPDDARQRHELHRRHRGHRHPLLLRGLGRRRRRQRGPEVARGLAPSRSTTSRRRRPTGLAAVGRHGPGLAFLDRQHRARPRRLRPLPRRGEGQHHPDHRHAYTDTGRADGTPTPTPSRPSTPTATRARASAPSRRRTASGARTPFDGTFETGTDGAASSGAWTLSGTPQRREYDNMRAKNGTLSAWIQGPATAAYAGVVETASAGMTSNGAEERFWLYADTTNQIRFVNGANASTTLWAAGFRLEHRRHDRRLHDERRRHRLHARTPTPPSAPTRPAGPSSASSTTSPPRPTRSPRAPTRRRRGRSSRPPAPRLRHPVPRHGHDHADRRPGRSGATRTRTSGSTTCATRRPASPTTPTGPWNVTASAGADGSIAPLGLPAVAHGANSPVFTITPDPAT